MDYIITRDTSKKNDELYHHGVKGQKWGIRRYQNKDGTLTELGKQKIQDSGGDIYPENGYKWTGIKKKYLVRDTKNYKNRWDVYDEYSEKLFNLPSQSGSNWMKYDGADARLLLKTIDKYADATIADLKLKNNPKTHAYVKKYIRNTLDECYERDLKKYDTYKKYMADTRPLKERLKELDDGYRKRIKEADRNESFTTEGDLIWDEWQAAREAYIMFDKAQRQRRKLAITNK